MRKGRIQFYNFFKVNLYLAIHFKSVIESFSDTIDIKLESPESQTFSEPAKIAKLSTAECSSSNVLDDTNKLSEKSDFSFSLTENSEDNHSLPLFNSQGDIHSRLMKSNPACTSHIPEDHQTSSQEHCSEVSHGRASTFKNPFDSSDED